jgi:putative ABC transport system permease protein
MKRLLRGALSQGVRLFGTALAVALAVTLVSGTFILTDTVDSAFHKASADVGGTSDLIIRSTASFQSQANSLPERQPVPESLVEQILAIPGVKTAWTAIQGYAELLDKQGKAIQAKGMPTVGSSVSPDVSLASGRAPSGPDEIAIDLETARQHGLVLGDKIKVLFSGTTQEFTIGGLLQAAGDVVASTKAIFDSVTAQRVLGVEAGKVDAIPVEAEAGLSADDLRARINAVLPDEYEAVTARQVAAESAESWTKSVAFLPTALLLFAGVALLVGAFIICNTFSILVAQRYRELALLRSLGASRAQLTASVLCEAVAVGFVGSVAGILAGFGVAKGLLALFSSVGFELPTTGAVFLPRTALVGVVVGVVVTVLAAVPPARRATQVAPVRAMRGADGARSAPAGRRRLLFGTAMGAAGLATLLTGVLGRGSVASVGVGAAMILASLSVLIPLVARTASQVVGAPLVRFLGEPAFLGRENAMRSPRRTASTAAALMIGIGLVGVVAILAASVKASASRTVDDSLRADFVLTPTGLGGAVSGVPPVVIDRLRETPAVATVSEIKGGQWGLDGRNQTLLAVDPTTVTTMHEVDAASAAAVRRLDDSGVLVRDTVAERYGWVVGDKVPMTFARTGTRDMKLQGVFSSTAVRTDFVITLGAYKANYAQHFSLEVDVALAAGVTPAAGRAALEEALVDFPVVKIMDHAEVLAAADEQVDRILVPVTALLALSVLIALLGIANTLALSIFERTREMGLLRALGMARAQLRSMIRSEAAIIACLGATLGVCVALFFGWALVASMKNLGVTELVFPFGQLTGLAVVVTAAGMLAAILPGRKAASLEVLKAISSDR